MAPVNPEVLFVRRPYLAGIAQLGHGHEASVSELHLAIGIFVEEFQDARDVRRKIEIEHQITPSHKPDAQAGVAREESQLIEHGFTRGKRYMGGEFAPSPWVEWVPSVQRRKEQTGISDVLHGAVSISAEQSAACFHSLPGQHPGKGIR
jgi:hypothetical protein